MSYDEILEKIKKARLIADSRKVQFSTGQLKPSEPEKVSESKSSNPPNLEYRTAVKDWSQPTDLAPDGKTFLDLFRQLGLRISFCSLLSYCPR